MTCSVRRSVSQSVVPSHFFSLFYVILSDFKSLLAISRRFLFIFFLVFWSLTVSGQNTKGIYIIPLTMTQRTAHKRSIVCNNQLFKLQPTVTNKMLYAISGCWNHSWL